MAVFNWTFHDVDVHIIIWMTSGLGAFTLELCLLLLIMSRFKRDNASRGWCGCNALMSCTMMLSLFLNLAAVLVIGSNNGDLPRDYSHFEEMSADHYSLGQKLYFMLFSSSMNTLNAYCLIVICIGTLSALSSIRRMQWASACQWVGIPVILWDAAGRILSVLMYFVPMMAPSPTLYASWFGIGKLFDLVFLTLLFMVRCDGRSVQIEVRCLHSFC